MRKVGVLDGLLTSCSEFGVFFFSLLEYFGEMQIGRIVRLLAWLECMYSHKMSEHVVHCSFPRVKDWT